MKFSELHVIPPILSALDKLNFKQATPIQQQTIPPILNGSDIFGCAQTGTGKTAAFSLPILQQLSIRKGRKSISAVILAPTRELASQIHESIRSYNVHLKLRHTVIFGGVSQVTQVHALRNGVDILVATPGRLLDLMNQGYVNLKSVEYFVLDEADRMLDMGFIRDIRKIIALLPARRQSLFFSATATPEIMKLAGTILKNPVKVSVAPVSSVVPNISQSIYHVSKEDKRSLLKYLFRDGKIDHALIFTRTKRGADRVARELNNHGIVASSIHGDKSQGARTKALDAFKTRRLRALVATDVASRGIDIDNLNYVINFEMPEQPETYVHRIGRTGRAGKNGNAMSFCSGDELPYLQDIRKLTNAKMEVVQNHPYKK